MKYAGFVATGGGNFSQTIDQLVYRSKDWARSRKRKASPALVACSDHC
jgi:hypothetical protein